MKLIPITITQKTRGLVISSPYSNKDISTQYDNLVQELIIERPIEYELSTLSLVFSTCNQNFTPIDIGTQNTFIIPNSLTQDLHLKLQCYFLDNGTELDHTNILNFNIRPSLNGGEIPVEPWPDPILEILDKAFFNADDNDPDFYQFFNARGKLLDSIRKVSGGSSGFFSGSWHYNFKNDTDKDPNKAQLMFNSNTAMTTTELKMSIDCIEGDDILNFLMLLSKGSMVRLQRFDSHTEWQGFKIVSDPINFEDFVYLPVEWVAGEEPLTEHKIKVAFAMGSLFGVTKEYVDSRDNEVLNLANNYTDIQSINMTIDGGIF